MQRPKLTLGVEEEYLLVDPETRELASRPPKEFMERCRKELGPRVMHEFLQSQIEVATSPCASVLEVASQLRELRATISSCAEEFGMRMIASATHPWAPWHSQVPVEMERYQILMEAHQALARRMVICGTHVHAGVEDDNLRIELMNQATYFMPHLLALSTSSPFWEGYDTGLKAFRPTIFGNMPRSGLPETFESFTDWEEMLQLLARTEFCDDASKIWWDIRPSARHPTLEMRICDMCTSIEDTISITALYQAILAMLYSHRTNNLQWRNYRRIFIAENKWIAQRYGIHGRMADLGRGMRVDFAELTQELIELLREQATELGSLAEIEHALTIVERGTSADRQLAIYREALADGVEDHDAQIRVVDWLMDATLEGLNT